MPTDLIRYDLLVQEALRSVVRRVLGDAAKQGMPGDHHFYVSFRIAHPGVRLSQRLREKYPEEMTVVLQHQFWDLGVTEHGFEVGLSFGGVPERLLVPFEAISGFYDPSVEFGLKFEAAETEAGNDDQAPKGAAGAPAPTGPSLVPSPVAALPAPRPAAAAKRRSRGAGSEPDVLTPKDEGAPDAPPKDPSEKDAPAKGAAKNGPAKGDEPAEAKPPAAVVSLDAFRKKK